MGPYSRFHTNSCRGKSKVLHISFLSRPLQRQISAVISFAVGNLRAHPRPRANERTGQARCWRAVQTSANLCKYTPHPERQTRVDSPNGTHTIC